MIPGDLTMGGIAGEVGRFSELWLEFCPKEVEREFRVSGTEEKAQIFRCGQSPRLQVGG